MTDSFFDDAVKQFLTDKLDLIKLEYSPTALIVFGSRAAGTARPDSDIDLIVVSERFRDIRFPNRMGDFLNKIWPEVHVDAICYTPEEFEEMKERPFLKKAVAQGIRVE